ncbi:hypothetical protein E2562_001497 [Oryza meyeriana var. granulata]|uniref:ZF-HD dimerization-type domain-containing protein n=1 Tax=Oryza meyeriana var. granulata TaxID=110450 RepID=A0A6G1DCV2_9ORYZ|nr:hypothetical protein E2562_001497 [Oryza meyeriana var. granulata]
MEQQQQERPREVYRKCMRNHAAKLGTYANDGCCEYTPDDGHPAGLLCAACGCHRNFHWKEILDGAAAAGAGSAGAVVGVSPHAPMLPSSGGGPPGYMQMAMGGAGVGGGDGSGHGSGGRRRTRTKFTEEQKARMLRFAERLGWRMPKREPGRAPGDDEVSRFCREIGVNRQVFKEFSFLHFISYRQESFGISIVTFFETS